MKDGGRVAMASLSFGWQLLIATFLSFSVFMGLSMTKMKEGNMKAGIIAVAIIFLLLEIFYLEGRFGELLSQRMQADLPSWLFIFLPPSSAMLVIVPTLLAIMGWFMGFLPARFWRRLHRQARRESLSTLEVMELEVAD
jgi:hypothetical protein